MSVVLRAITVLALVLLALQSASPAGVSFAAPVADLSADDMAWIEQVADGIAAGMEYSGGMAASERPAWKNRMRACLTELISGGVDRDVANTLCYGQAWRQAGLRKPEDVAWADANAAALLQGMLGAGLTQAEAPQWEQRLRTCLDAKAWFGGGQEKEEGIGQCRNRAWMEASLPRSTVAAAQPAAGQPNEVDAWMRMLRGVGLEHSEPGWERMRQCLTMQWNAGKHDFESAAMGCMGVED